MQASKGETLMKPNIFKSRKFWIAMADVVFSTAVYFVTKYAAPDLAKDLLWVIGAYQPVILTLIGSIAYEDGKAIENPQ
jgi:hypothetical protein